MTTKITEKNISNLANAGVQWQSVFYGDGSTALIAIAGQGYFIDTTSGTVSVTNTSLTVVPSVTPKPVVEPSPVYDRFI